MEIIGNLSKSSFKGLMRLEARMMGEELSGSQNGDKYRQLYPLSGFVIMMLVTPWGSKVT